MKSIFIVWGREIEHSRYLAEALGSQLKQIYIKKIGKIDLPVVLRYIWQGAKTILVLAKERPHMIIVQNPPVFASLLVMFYCSLFKTRFITDTHTAFFLDKKWTYFHWLFRLIAPRAVLNTCHNFKNLEILRKWGIKKSMVMRPHNPDYSRDGLSAPLKNGGLEKMIKNSRQPIMMVNRFAEDDDWRTVLETSKIMPATDFFITGSIPDNLDYLKNEAPNNVHFTGYLEHDEFMKLMWRCEAVLSLTLRRDTILWSIGEAMSLGKPFITSDTEVLRHYYGEAAIFSGSDPDKLKESINKALANKEDIKIKIQKTLDRDRHDWQEKIRQIKNIIN